MCGNIEEEIGGDDRFGGFVEKRGVLVRVAGEVAIASIESASGCLCRAAERTMPQSVALSVRRAS